MPARRKTFKVQGTRLQRKLFLFLAVAALAFAGGVMWVTNRRVETSTGSGVSACLPQELSGSFIDGEDVAFFEGRELAGYKAAASLVEEGVGGRRVLGTVSGGVERWVEVDLSDQKLMAWEGDKLFLESPISSGLPWSPTPTGEFRVWIKLKYTKMEGGVGRNYYYLPNVPYVMYFENEDVPGWKGYGLHGTYWHNDFGTPKSHGCVNLPTGISEQIFYWGSPGIPEGKGVVKTGDELGMRIVIHE